MRKIKDENVHRFVKNIHRVPIIHSNGYMYTGREREVMTKSITVTKHGRKRPLDTPKKKIERRERERGSE